MSSEPHRHSESGGGEEGRAEQTCRSSTMLAQNPPIPLLPAMQHASNEKGLADKTLQEKVGLLVAASTTGGETISVARRNHSLDDPKLDSHQFEQPSEEEPAEQPEFFDCEEYLDCEEFELDKSISLPAASEDTECSSQLDNSEDSQVLPLWKQKQRAEQERIYGPGARLYFLQQDGRPSQGHRSRTSRRSVSIGGKWPTTQSKNGDQRERGDIVFKREGAAQGGRKAVSVP